MADPADGLDLVLTAILRTFPPIAEATAAEPMSYDKALPYPAPTMVDGRPT